MAHNKTVLLTAADKARATKARKMLDAAEGYGERVLVNYVKRDGTEKRVEGAILSRLGVDDKEAVILDTIEGPRTINVWRAKSVVLMGQ